MGFGRRLVEILVRTKQVRMRVYAHKIWGLSGIGRAIPVIAAVSQEGPEPVDQGTQSGSRLSLASLSSHQSAA